jgi:glycosidase
MSQFARVGGFARRIAACGVVLVAAVVVGGPASKADQPPHARSRWEGDIVYHIFTRSYRDSDGDRIGDFRGITAALATIDSLGCTAILLAPVVEARVYHNYFADDFFAVDRSFGSLDDFRTLVREAHGRDLKVILDMEPQYVADGHPWLRPASAGAASPFADYLWRGGPLNGDSFVWYDRRHIGISPVNLRNAEVRAYVGRVFRFWAEQGVDGFRIDHMMDDLDRQGVQTGLLASLWDPLERDLRREYPRAFFVGEQGDWGTGRDILQGTATDAVFAFQLMGALRSLDKAQIEAAMREMAAATPAGKTQLTFLENHDMDRFASVEPDARKQRLAAALLFTLKGTPSIYYGQELGMRGRIGNWGGDGNHIPVRLAYRWTRTLDGPGTATWYRDTGPWWSPTWSSDGDGISLEEEAQDPESLLRVYRRLGQLRRATPALRIGSQAIVPVASPRVLAFERREGSRRVVVVANLGGADENAVVPGTGRLRDLWSGSDYAAGQPVALGPYGFRILEASARPTAGARR